MLGALVLVVGMVTFYVREEIVAREAFADRALVALEDDACASCSAAASSPRRPNDDSL